MEGGSPSSESSEGMIPSASIESLSPSSPSCSSSSAPSSSSDRHACLAESACCEQATFGEFDGRRHAGKIDGSHDRATRHTQQPDRLVGTADSQEAERLAQTGVKDHCAALIESTAAKAPRLPGACVAQRKLPRGRCHAAHAEELFLRLALH
eukprot:884233-Prymnesium_polylepis.2